MVHGRYADSQIKGPFKEIKKEKTASPSGSHQRPQSTQQQNKDNKYGAWGPVYKDKQNFINMHIC